MSGLLDVKQEFAQDKVEPVCDEHRGIPATELLNFQGSDNIKQEKVESPTTVDFKSGPEEKELHLGSENHEVRKENVVENASTPATCSSDHNRQVVRAQWPFQRSAQWIDEQLAITHQLPVTVKQIVEMSTSELRQLWKNNEQLTETQKAAIRRIRRRGKQRLAAIALRRRRTGLGMLLHYLANKDKE